jgi:hypothetical protein
VVAILYSFVGLDVERYLGALTAPQTVRAARGGPWCFPQLIVC